MENENIEKDELGGYFDENGVYHWENLLWDDDNEMWLDVDLAQWRDPLTLEPVGDPIATNWEESYERRESAASVPMPRQRPKIAKKKVKITSPLLIPIINLERPLEKVLEKGEYIAIKSHNTPGVTDSGSYEINLPYYGGGSPEEWLVWKD